MGSAAHRAIFLSVLIMMAVHHSNSVATRTNYASAFLGAQIVEHHDEAKGCNNLLNDDQEKYLIMPCKAERKLFTIQLSRDIEVGSVVLSNKEFFSSGVKNFTLLGSKTFPCVPPSCLWRVLGSFQANFSRDAQMFHIQRQPAVRFVRFLWVSTHGSQRSCTMTSFRVFGSDVLDTLAAEFDGQDNTTFIDDAHQDLVANLHESFATPHLWLRNTSSNVCTNSDREFEELSQLAMTPWPKKVLPPVNKTKSIFVLDHISRLLKAAQRDVNTLLSAVSELNESITQKYLYCNTSLRSLEKRHNASRKEWELNLIDVSDAMSLQLESIRRDSVPRAVFVLSVVISLFVSLLALGIALVCELRRRSSLRAARK